MGNGGDVGVGKWQSKKIADFFLIKILIIYF